MAIKFRLIFIIISISFNLLDAQENISLKKALSIANENNTRVINARKDIETAKSKLVQAGVYSNPSIDFQTPNLTDSMMSSYELSLNQELEIFGKRTKRRDIAEDLITIAGEQLKSVWLDVALEVKEKYYELLLIQKRNEIARENLNLVRKLLDSVQVKYQSGSIYLNELLRAKIELSQAKNELILIEREMKVVKSQFNLLLGKSVSNEYKIEENLYYQEKKLDYDTLKSKSFSQNPDLKSKIIITNLSKKGIQLANLDILPNPTVGLIFSREEQSSKPLGLGVSLGFSIPLWYRNSGEIKEKEIEMEKAENDIDYFRKQLELNIYDAYIEAESATRQVELLKNNVDEAIEIQNLIDLQYREGKADFLMYLDNLKTVRNVKLNYYEAITNYENKLALIERIIGEDIE